MKNYIIEKTEENFKPEKWETVNVAELDQNPWKDYPCPYKTKAQLLYTDSALFVHLLTTETKIRAINNEVNSNVSEDSCMEFFLSPDVDCVCLPSSLKTIRDILTSKSML